MNLVCLGLSVHCLQKEGLEFDEPLVSSCFNNLQVSASTHCQLHETGITVVGGGVTPSSLSVNKLQVYSSESWGRRFMCGEGYPLWICFGDSEHNLIAFERSNWQEFLPQCRGLRTQLCGSGSQGAQVQSLAW